MSVVGPVLDLEPVWADSEAWLRRLESDAAQIERCLPRELQQLHGAVVERARSGGAKALILSGSTARGTRTGISDLDYHLVGPAIETKDLSRELDLHLLSEAKLESAILAGDDFVHWSLRFGCVVLDDGTVRRALRLIAERRPWPDVGRKREHAEKSLELAGRFVETGDEDGALEQVRTALSIAARARLLSAGIFPLSRAELPAQLEQLGLENVGRALAAAIHNAPTLTELAEAVRSAEAMLAGVRADAHAGHEANRRT